MASNDARTLAQSHEQQPQIVAPDNDVKTLAQSFANDLDNMFGLSAEVDGLTNTVNQRKSTITTSTMELQELEARIKAMEDRLAKVSPARAPPPPPVPQMRDEPQQVLGAAPSTQQQQQRTSPLGSPANVSCRPASDGAISAAANAS